MAHDSLLPPSVAELRLHLLDPVQPGMCCASALEMNVHADACPCMCQTAARAVAHRAVDLDQVMESGQPEVVDLSAELSDCADSECAHDRTDEELSVFSSSSRAPSSWSSCASTPSRSPVLGMTKSPSMGSLSSLLLNDSDADADEDQVIAMMAEEDWDVVEGMVGAGKNLCHTALVNIILPNHPKIADTKNRRRGGRRGTKRRSSAGITAADGLHFAK